MQNEKKKKIIIMYLTFWVFTSPVAKETKLTETTTEKEKPVTA